MRTKELAWPHDKLGTAIDIAYRSSVQNSVQPRHALVLNTSTQPESNSLRLHSAADREMLIRF